MDEPENMRSKPVVDARTVARAVEYGEAWALARAHARSGDSVAVSAYLGGGDVFDGCVADFADAYADQNERDHRAYPEAIGSSRVST